MIDGGNKVTLDGGGGRADPPLRQPELAGQRDPRDAAAHRVRARQGDADRCRSRRAPAPCSQGFNDGEGGAIYMRDGNLTVIDALFDGQPRRAARPRHRRRRDLRCSAASTASSIVGSTFRNNSASNGGAIGCLFAELDIYNSLFKDNNATGHDANNDDATQVHRDQQRPARDRLGRQRRRASTATASRRDNRSTYPVRRQDRRTTPPAPTRSAAACSSRATTTAAR